MGLPNSQAVIEVGSAETMRDYLEPLVTPADPSMRAGQHTISDLEKMLGATLAPDAIGETDRKWPLAYSLSFVVLSSALLWAGIIFGIARLF
jgi:hypothetical protein